MSRSGHYRLSVISGPLGLRGHLVMSCTRRRSDDHCQQEPQLVAQASARPVINDSVEVLGQRVEPGTHHGVLDGVPDRGFAVGVVACAGRGKAR